jgi:hypothetical protein
MLLSLSRRGRWALGFGPFPIIFSTNLFLLFRPEWFFLQFAMVTVGILGKEFLRWERDGRSTHIFNPSALSLFVFSIALIVTGSTSVSYAEEIATTLNRPPYIYLHIFLLGLVVQSLFSVTLVTLMSALALLTLNLAYTGITGTYWFVDSNIPIAVFLGLHLLITDPSTSPRTALGKAFFGLLYGSAVFLLYGVLGSLGAPTFYDKLLCVPVLNLMVPLLDAAARRLRPVPSAASGRLYSEISPRSNRRHMLAWIALFAIMFSTHFVGPDHPGASDEFWEKACERDLHNACQVLYDINWHDCEDGEAGACLRASDLLASARLSVTDPLARGQLLSAACDRGDRDGCRQFREYIENGGAEQLRYACGNRNYAACYMSGLVSMFGIGVPADAEAALAAWETACAGRWSVACGLLAESYLQGRGVSADPARAAGYLDSACDQGYGSGCATLGKLYQQGHGVPLDAERGDELLREACQRGVVSACRKS